MRGLVSFYRTERRLPAARNPPVNKGAGQLDRRRRVSAAGTLSPALRSVLTRVELVLWSALLRAAAFSAAGRMTGHCRFTGGVILAFVGVSVLRGLRDSIGGMGPARGRDRREHHSGP